MSATSLHKRHVTSTTKAVGITSAVILIVAVVGAGAWWYWTYNRGDYRGVRRSEAHEYGHEAVDSWGRDESSDSLISKYVYKFAPKRKSAADGYVAPSVPAGSFGRRATRDAEELADAAALAEELRSDAKAREAAGEAAPLSILGDASDDESDNEIVRERGTKGDAKPKDMTPRKKDDSSDDSESEMGNLR